MNDNENPKDPTSNVQKISAGEETADTDNDIRGRCIVRKQTEE